MYMIGLRIARKRRFYGPDSSDDLESGTLISVNSNIAGVQWDSGEIEQFNLCLDSDETRLGELVVLDNAPAGVSHKGVACNTCHACPLPGIRWQCHKGYSLCTKCYMGDAPSTNHGFTRILMPSSGSVDVGNRAGTEKVKVNGIFPRAMVVLNSTGATGEVLEATSYERSANSGIKVRWCSPEGGTTICKLGFKGEVDVKCTKAAPDLFYYQKHLSTLHEHFLSQHDNNIVKGEKVYTYVDEDVLRIILVFVPEKLKQNISKVSGTFGLVERVTMNEWLVVNYGGYRCILPHYIVMKVPIFYEGDQVRVMDDEAQLKKYLVGHGGWHERMKQILGEICQVVKVDEDGDVEIERNGHVFLVNPVALYKENNMARMDDLMMRSPPGVFRALCTTDQKQFQYALRQLNIGSVNDKFEGRETLLHIAATVGVKYQILNLLRWGADVSIKDNNSYTALHRAARRNMTGDVIEILLKHGADCNEHDNPVRESPLHLAVKGNNIKAVQALLRHEKCDVNLQNAEKDTSLHIAIRNGNRRTVDLLLGHGNVDCSLSNKGGYNALQFAALLGDTKTVEAILQHDHNLLNATMTSGFSLLHLAAHENRVGVAKVLLKKKCDVNATTKEHLTALHLAASQGHHTMTSCLLEAGADRCMKDKDGDTVFTMVFLQQVSCIRSWKPNQDVTQKRQTICKYCRKEPALAFFKPCGHKIACTECALKRTEGECKECGMGVKRIISPDLISKRKVLLPEESLLKRDARITILRRKVKEEGDTWELAEAAAFINFPPKAVTESMEMTCSLLSPRTCSPPLDENEALVSNVIELSRDGLPGLNLGRDFNEGVSLALCHSATDLKGYEVVIQQLMDPKNNEWEDLETRNMWSESGIQGDPLIRTGISGFLFPLAEATVTQCSSFAVIWRLKSFTFSSSTNSKTDPVFTCIVPEYPDVSVAIPRSDLPESGDFSLTIKVQEVPCDEVKDDGMLVGPILHISSSPDVQFLEPVTIKVPFSLREAKNEVVDLSSGQLRILFFNCGGKDPAWRDITDELETPADVKDGMVTFQVKHFSKVSPLFLKRKRKPSSSELQRCVKKPKMPQEAGFLACLRETSRSGTLMLTLFCYPLQMECRVTSAVSSRPKVLGQVQKNGIEKMCKEDKAFVTVMKQIKPLEDIDLENFFLRFLGDDPFERDMLVSVEGDGVPKVELTVRREDQQEGKLMCELFFSELQIPSSVSRAEDCSSTTPTSQTNRSLTSASLEVLEQGNPSYPSKKKLKVTLLADEWGSPEGGLSNLNRELAKYLAKHPTVEVTLLLPHCSERDKEEARQCNISVMKAKEKTGFKPQAWLSFPPTDLAIDVVIGHGVELGRHAPTIRDSHKCKWAQVVHKDPEELGMHKSYKGAIDEGDRKHQTEVELCEQADLVVAIGPKLTEKASSNLRSCGKDVFSLIPGIFMEFLNVKQTSQDLGKFRLLIFDRGDPEEFFLRGFDIAAKAVAELKDNTYQLLFVGAPGEHQHEVTNKLLEFIPKDQLTVRGYVQTRQELKKLFCEVDLAIMPSRTAGFGLTALEALSAGLPILVSRNSGLGEALQKVPSGSSCVVESKDALDWAKAIKCVREKKRDLRLKEVTMLREHYAETYSWEEQCERIVKKMCILVDGSS